MDISPLPPNSTSIRAIPVEGEVVILSSGPRPIDAAFTPEAILASLEGLRRAAEMAFAQRERLAEAMDQ